MVNFMAQAIPSPLISLSSTERMDFTIAVIDSMLLLLLLELELSLIIWLEVAELLLQICFVL